MEMRVFVPNCYCLAGFIFLLLLVCYTSSGEICKSASQTQVIPICTSSTETGSSIRIDTSMVPPDEEIVCNCSVAIPAGAKSIEAVYNLIEDNFTYCGLNFSAGYVSFSCVDHSRASISNFTVLRFKKTKIRANACFTLIIDRNFGENEKHNATITCFENSLASILTTLPMQQTSPTTTAVVDDPTSPNQTTVVDDPTSPTPTAVVVDQTSPTTTAVVVELTSPTPSTVFVYQTSPTLTTLVVDQTSPTSTTVVVDQTSPTTTVVKVEQTSPTPTKVFVDQTSPTPTTVVIDQTSPTSTAVVVDQTSPTPTPSTSPRITPPNTSRLLNTSTSLTTSAETDRSDEQPVKETANTDKSTVIIAVAASGGGAGFFLAVVIVCCCFRHRQWKGSQKDKSPKHECVNGTGDQEVTVNDVYNMEFPDEVQSNDVICTYVSDENERKAISVQYKNLNIADENMGVYNTVEVDYKAGQQENSTIKSYHLSDMVINTSYKCKGQEMKPETNTPKNMQCPDSDITYSIVKKCKSTKTNIGHHRPEQIQMPDSSETYAIVEKKRKT